MKKVFIRKEPRIPFTEKGYQELAIQREKLLFQRPEAVDHLREAREMGDLSENGYYKESRARLSFIDSQIRRLDRLIKWGVVIEPLGNNQVGIGNEVILTDGKKKYQYALVGGYESDPAKGLISHRSPVGMALMGKKEQDVVNVFTPGGKVQYTILKIIRAK